MMLALAAACLSSGQVGLAEPTRALEVPYAGNTMRIEIDRIECMSTTEPGGDEIALYAAAAVTYESRYDERRLVSESWMRMPGLMCSRLNQPPTLTHYPMGGSGRVVFKPHEPFVFEVPMGPRSIAYGAILMLEADSPAHDVPPGGLTHETLAESLGIFYSGLPGNAYQQRVDRVLLLLEQALRLENRTYEHDDVLGMITFSVESAYLTALPRVLYYGFDNYRKHVDSLPYELKTWWHNTKLHSRRISRIEANEEGRSMLKRYGRPWSEADNPFFAGDEERSQVYDFTGGGAEYRVFFRAKQFWR
ncbi:MAG: hypothetical protein IH851_02000 [Armatimonadetes bacterium]|nr:hypothetical protein [Armatimonadota bacterium]